MSYEMFGVTEINAVRLKRYDGEGKEFYIIEMQIVGMDVQDDKIWFYSNEPVEIDVKDFVPYRVPIETRK